MVIMIHHFCCRRWNMVNALIERLFWQNKDMPLVPQPSQSQSATFGEAGGSKERERLKAAKPFGPKEPPPRSADISVCRIAGFQPAGRPALRGAPDCADSPPTGMSAIRQERMPALSFWASLLPSIPESSNSASAPGRIGGLSEALVSQTLTTQSEHRRFRKKYKSRPY